MPKSATSTNIICVIFKISPNINAAKIVAVMGCIKSPTDPSEADIFPIPWVIKYWPPNWHKTASNNKFIHSNEVDGIIFPPWISIGIIENKQQNNVV